MKQYITRATAAVLLTLLAVVGCKSGKNAGAVSERRFERPPLVEVDEGQLAEEAMVAEAKMQFEAGNQEAAEKLYRKLLNQNPACAAAHYELGRIMQESHRDDSALYHLHRASELMPTNIWYQRMLAGMYGLRQEWDNKAAVEERIVELQPDKPNNYYELADTYLHAGRTEKSIATLNRAEARFGITEPVSLQKQQLWESLGEQKKAMKEIEALATTIPHDMKYNAIIAESYMRQKDYAHAKPFYDNIARNNPDDEYIHFSLANYYKLTGDMGKAMDELETGFLNPKMDCGSKLKILATFFSSEDFYRTYAPRTFALTDTLVSHCDDSMAYALFYGDMKMRQGKYDEAYGLLRTHLRHDSSQYEAWEALLICESMLKDKDSIQRLDARRAKELFPLHLLPRYLTAVGAYEEKRYDDAIADAEYCRKLGFRNGYLEGECYGLLSECYYLTGQYEKAWDCFEQYLKLYPDDWGMMNNYAYFLAERESDPERLKQAERMSRRTVEAEPENATFLDTYAWVLHKLGRDREALPYMRQAIENDKKGSETLKEHYKTILQHQ